MSAPPCLRRVRALEEAGYIRGYRALLDETKLGYAVTAFAMVHLASQAEPELSNDVDLFPGQRLRWGLGGMLHLDPGPDGRGAGSWGWAGLFNSYYWIDPARRVCGVIMTQILPFADPRVLRLYGRFERAVYDALA